MIGKAAEKLGGALVPPGFDPTTWWRLAVSATLVGVLVWIAWAMGAFATLLNTPGLALADEQKQILTELHDQKVERVEAAILQAQRDYCEAAADEKPRQFYLERRNMKLNEYFALTGRAYQGMPDCDEL